MNILYVSTSFGIIKIEMMIHINYYLSISNSKLNALFSLQSFYISQMLGF